jgi:hypothetical protein
MLLDRYRRPMSDFHSGHRSPAALTRRTRPRRLEVPERRCPLDLRTGETYIREHAYIQVHAVYPDPSRQGPWRSRDHEVVCMPRLKRSPLKFEERIAAEKARLETQAARLPHDPERDALQKKIRQLAIAVHMNEWMTSP